MKRDFVVKETSIETEKVIFHLSKLLLDAKISTAFSPLGLHIPPYTYIIVDDGDIFIAPLLQSWEVCWQGDTVQIRYETGCITEVSLSDPDCFKKVVRAVRWHLNSFEDDK